MGSVATLKAKVSDALVRATMSSRTGVVPGALRTLTGVADNTVPAWWFVGRPNFGDLISPVILREMCGVEPVRVSANFRGKVLGAGSILNAARPDDVVWGSGSIQDRPLDGRGITFSAVRGPRTRALVTGDVPERFGDPGILMPMIYEPKQGDHRYEVALVPHYKDKDVLTMNDSNVVEIDIEDTNWKRTIDLIVACDVVVSSSLHGIIVAEAYGIPAVWVQPTDRLKGGAFKFHDYYEGTNRDARLADWHAGLVATVASALAPPILDTAPLLASRPFLTS